MSAKPPTDLDEPEGVRDRRTLGTALRRLVELLDGEVSRAYAEAGLDYRATFTPVVRALVAAQGSLSVREIAATGGTSHAAASQTVAQMRRAGLLDPAPAADGRERRVQLSAHAHLILPAVTRQWARTEQAVAELDGELGVRLSDVINSAIEILERRPFLTADDSGPPAQIPPRQDA